MNDQTKAKKIKTGLKQTWCARKYACIVAANMIHVNGKSPTFAAKMLGVDRGTISDWLGAYDRKGLDGLADDARQGRPPLVPRDRMER